MLYSSDNRENSESDSDSGARRRQKMVVHTRDGQIAYGFTLVLNTTSDALQSNSPVVYSNGDNDITDEIIKQLNAGAPDTMPTPDSAKGTTNSDTKKK